MEPAFLAGSSPYSSLTGKDGKSARERNHETVFSHKQMAQFCVYESIRKGNQEQFSLKKKKSSHSTAQVQNTTPHKGNNNYHELKNPMAYHPLNAYLCNHKEELLCFMILKLDIGAIWTFI